MIFDINITRFEHKEPYFINIFLLIFTITDNQKLNAVNTNSHLILLFFKTIFIFKINYLTVKCAV